MLNCWTCAMLNLKKYFMLIEVISFSFWQHSPNINIMTQHNKIQHLKSYYEILDDISNINFRYAMTYNEKCIIYL